MKKKAKRYAEGGESVYERAKRFLQQGRPEQGEAPALRSGEETPALDERIAEARKQVAAVGDPLAGIIREAEAKHRESKTLKADTEDSKRARASLKMHPATEAVIREAKRRQDDEKSYRFANDYGLDIPAGLETQYMGTKDRPNYPTYKKGGMVSSASKRADGIATKGKTRGRYL